MGFDIFLFFGIFLLLIFNANTLLHSGPNKNNNIINYEYLRINKTVVDSIPCTPLPPCPKQTFHGVPIPKNSVLVDSERKILMEFSPKAGCTAAVIMFLNHMGFIQNEVYSVWPHLFREEYFFKRCGHATPCQYESPDWYRFKVVRNPYDRAVSSYIHMMKYPALRDMIVPPEKREDLTFEQFLQMLTKMPPGRMQGLLGAHAGYQSQPYERKFWRLRHNSTMRVFHHIVHSEDLDKDLEILNNATHGNFQKADKGIHLTHRKNDTNYFVGNVSWNVLLDHIPSDYGLFYNSHLKNLVTQIYMWDIEIYQYKFPFVLQF